jgi:hypothetical protein
MQQVINKGQIMNNANYYFCEQQEGQEKTPYIPHYIEIELTN